MQLHKLIKSLSKTEKRHFRLYAQMGSKTKPKYLKLFVLLDKQENYAEAILQKKGYTVSDRAFLMDKILDSLQLSYARKNNTSELHWLLGQFPQLWQRKLMDELRKRLRKAKQLAGRQENFSTLLQIIHWEKCIVNDKGGKTVLADYTLLEREEQELQKKLDNQLRYENLKIKLNLLRIKDMRLQKSENRSQFEAFIDTPLLQESPPLLSISAKANYYQIQCIVHRYQHKREMAYHYVRQLITLFETADAFRKLHLSWYKKTLCLHIEISFANGKQEDLPPLIDQIRSLCQTNRGLTEQELLSVSYFYGILHALGTVNKERGMLLIKEIEEQWDDLSPFIQDHRKLAYFYNIMLFYSLFGKWEQANVWLLRILHFKRITERKDIQNTARIWQMLLAYEMDSYTLDNHIQAAYKYLNRHEHYFEFETAMVKYFRVLFKVTDQASQQLVWQEMINQLHKLLEIQERGSQQLGLQEIFFWAKGKLVGQNIAEILKNWKP